MSPCDRPSFSISLLGGCGGLRSWLVLWPAPAHACNAVCNEKSKQGTAVRHDRNVFPLEGAPKKKKKIEKKEELEEALRQSCVQKERSLGPKRKTNVIVHRLSLCQSPPSPIGLWPPYQFLSHLTLSLLALFAQVDSDTVLNEPPPPFCTHGYRLCHRLKVRRGLQRAGR